MPDLTIRKDTELMVAHIEAVTPEGVDFVDSFCVERMAVLDSGVIIVHLDELNDLLVSAVALSATIVDLTPGVRT